MFFTCYLLPVNSCIPKAYSEPWQTSEIEGLAKTVNDGWKPLIIFTKRSILDLRQVSEHASVLNPSTGKYRTEKRFVWTLFRYWLFPLNFLKYSFQISADYQGRARLEEKTLVLETSIVADDGFYICETSKNGEVEKGHPIKVTIEGIYWHTDIAS